MLQPIQAEVSHGGRPVARTPLVGRDDAVASIRTLIDSGAARLVTLTGPGGIGKTRLALAVATAMEQEFAHGACFVALASVQDADMIPVMIARALGLQESRDQPAGDLVLAALRGRHLLLVLDNLEQVVDAAASWAGALLDQCPHLSVLATSRIALQIAGEHRFPVPPLALPDPSAGGAVDQLPSGAAVNLFIQRARAVSPGFALTSESADTVRQICIALDGLPLAIELAAARLSVLSPNALLARLTDRLSILQGTTRDVAPRHRTMRDTIAWSHDLLSPDQQELFRRLAVFSGGFTLEAAEAVAGETDASRVLELLTDLVTQSMVQRDVLETGEGRLRMLEVVREYALEVLEARGETDAARDAHAAWCGELASAAAAGIQGRDQIGWLRRLDAELDNIRGALAWLQERERIGEAQDLAGSVSIFFLIRAYYTEARALYEALVGHPRGAAPTMGRAWSLSGLATIAVHQGDIPRSMEAFDEAVAIFRSHDARQALVWALVCRGIAQIYAGRVEDAGADCREALELSQGEEYRWGEACARAILGSVLAQQGDLDGAAFQMQASIDVCRALGESWIRSIPTANIALHVMVPRGELDLAATFISEADRLSEAVGDRVNFAMSLIMRAEIDLARGEVEAAERLLRQGLEAARAAGDPYAAAYSLLGLGRIATLAGDHRGAIRAVHDATATLRIVGSASDVSASLDALADVAIAVGEMATAARLIGAADAALESEGSARTESGPGAHAERLARITGVLDEPAFQQALQGGRALSRDEALAEALAWEPASALAAREPEQVRGPAGDLSRRELEVLRLMAEGLTNQQIADRLFLSRRTATSHASNILAKLELPSRTAAVAWALRTGIA